MVRENRVGMLCINWRQAIFGVLLVMRLSTEIVSVHAAEAGEAPPKLAATDEVARQSSEIRPESRLASYVLSKERKQEMFRAGLFWERRLGLECKTEYLVHPLEISVLDPIVLPNTRNHPIKGIWHIRYELERCGSRKIYNAIFITKDGKQPDVRPYFPGTTLASHRLILDTLKTSASMALLKLDRSRGRKCANAELIDTSVVRYPYSLVEGNVVTRGVWNETWTFRGCEEDVTIAVTFVPNGKGGTSFFTERVPGNKENR